MAEMYVLLLKLTPRALTKEAVMIRQRRERSSIVRWFRSIISISFDCSCLCRDSTCSAIDCCRTQLELGLVCYYCIQVDYLSKLKLLKVLFQQPRFQRLLS
jgi:hypothetical protein